MISQTGSGESSVGFFKPFDDLWECKTVVLPERWIVELTFAWLASCPPMSRMPGAKSSHSARRVGSGWRWVKPSHSAHRVEFLEHRAHAPAEHPLCETPLCWQNLAMEGPRNLGRLIDSDQNCLRSSCDVFVITVSPSRLDPTA